MEVEITHLIGEDLFSFSHSRHEGGENAGRNSRQAALEKVRERPLLENEEAVEAGRDFIRATGGWSKEEINEMSDEQINALVLQFVASSVRECPLKLDDVDFEDLGNAWRYTYTMAGAKQCGNEETRSEAYTTAARALGLENANAECLEEIDWEEMRELADIGLICCRLYQNEDGKIYFRL